jgi:MoaA/NifB/PqqE/SkfB family radical SAM enzyme
MPPICQQQLVDSFQRPVNYLRISVTDRCNLNCRYCAPFTPQHLDREDLLSLEEIYRIALIGTRLESPWCARASLNLSNSCAASTP